MTKGSRKGLGRDLVGAGLVVTILLGGAFARAAEPDPWFGRDKALHFGVTALIASDGYFGTALATEDRRVRLAVGGGLALAAGVGKELWDLSGRGDASWRDLTWDVVGTATGLAVAAALDWTIDWTLGRLLTRHAAPP